MRTHRKSSIVAAAIAAVAIGQRALAVDYVWQGGSGLQWSAGANWVPAGPPAAAADTAAFNNTGTANLINVVDAGLPGTTFNNLSYRQDNPALTYETSIDPNVTLTLTGRTGDNAPGVADSSLLVFPTNGASAGVTGTRVIIKSAPGAGTPGAMNITSGNVLISGQPLKVTSPATTNSFDSFAILDMRDLETFTYSQASNSTVAVGSGFYAGGSGVGTADTNAYWGQWILAKSTTIRSNRIVVGAQNNAGAGAANVAGMQPVSTMVLGPATFINDTALIAGNLHVGAGPDSPRTASGGIYFRAGLVNPTYQQGSNANTISGGAINIGRQTGNTSQGAFGVFDATSASAGADGILDVRIGSFTISTGASGGPGGGIGSFSYDRGLINFTGSGFVVGSTTNTDAQNANLNYGQLNIGVKGATTDAGQGALNLTNAAGTITLGRRNAATTNVNNVNMGVLSIANSATVSADRIFLGDNTGAGVTQGSAVGILNLLGGTLTIGKIQKGSDAAQAGTNSTRLVNFNGGTMQAKAGGTHNAAFMQDITAATVYSGGGTIDSNGENVTIAQPLIAPTGQGIGSITVDTVGSGYRVAPIVVISGGGGTGATAVSQINPDGTLKAVIVTNPGTGYTGAPTISIFANGGGSQTTNMLIPYGGAAATLTANLVNNVAGDFKKTGAGVVTLNPLIATDSAIKDLDNINVDAGTLQTMGMTASSFNSVTVNTGGGAELDTNNGGYVIKADTVANVRGLLLAGSGGPGFGAQTWDQPGINSSAAAADPLSLAVGYMDNDNFILGAKATFDGVSVPTGSILVKSTLAGDADLDWDVDDDDVTVLGIFYGQPGHWYEADFDYTGTVDDDDVTIMGITYGQSLPGAPGGVAAVPEPASLGLLGLAAAGVIRRRRRAE